MITRSGVIPQIRSEAQLPRGPVLPAALWDKVDAAVRERMEAVELFLSDYASRFRVRRELLDTHAVQLLDASRSQFESSMPLVSRRVWVAAFDLMLDSNGQLWFVDDHFCCPFGLYRLKQLAIGQKSESGQKALEDFERAMCRSAIRATGDGQLTVVLGTANFNSVYQENRYFADTLMCPYVGHRALQLTSDGLHLKTAGGLSRVGLVVRRLQDPDLDPNVYGPGSAQGIRGLIRNWSRRQFQLWNGPGTGVFNHRSVSRLIPTLIQTFLGRNPTLPTIPTWDGCRLESMLSDRKASLVIRTSDNMDSRLPVQRHDASQADWENRLRDVAINPDQFVVRRSLSDSVAPGARPCFAIRTFCVGDNRRHVLKTALVRNCLEDGTALGRVTQKTDATILSIGRTSA